MRKGALDPTDVVAAALHDRCRDLHSRRRASKRQVFCQQLALEGLRRRRDDDALPTHRRGHEIGQALANPRCSLGDQDATALDRGTDLFCQPQLPVARAKPGEHSLERRGPSEFFLVARHAGRPNLPVQSATRTPAHG